MLAPDAVHGMVIYHNLEPRPDGSLMQTGLIFGPGCTCHTPEEVIDKYPQIGDMPSRFRYPVAYVLKEGKCPN